MNPDYVHSYMGYKYHNPNQEVGVNALLIRMNVNQLAVCQWDLSLCLTGSEHEEGGAILLFF